MSGGRGHVIKPKNEVPRLIIIVFALAGLVAVLTMISLFAPGVVDFIFPEEELFNDNRTWLTRIWTQSERRDEEFTSLIAILEDNGITQVYVQTHIWRPDTGELTEFPFSQTFLSRIKRDSALIEVYAWMNINQAQLFDEATRDQVTEAARVAAREQGFDGIHIQASFVPDNSEDFMTLLRDLRAVMGPRVPLSITVPPDRTPTDPDVPSSPGVDDSLTWSQDFKRRVALNVNEMVLMGHASGLTSVEDYENWLAYQVATYAQIIDGLDIPMRYIVALPTYEAELGHDPEVENVETALNGIAEGVLRARSAGSEVDGVGLYPWEDTDLHELDAYWAGWASERR
jgi:hypothetical protein